MRASPTREKGASILEVLVAFMILLIIMVPVATVLANVLSQAGDARHKIAALSVAEKWLESLNDTGPHYNHTVPTVDVPIKVGTSCTGTCTTVTGMKYRAVGSFSWATPTNGAHPDICTSGSVPDVLRLTVTVTWGPSTGQTITDTILTDFPPSGLPENGFIGVQLQRSPTDPATLATPKSASGTTDWGGGVSTRVQDIPVTITRTLATQPAHPSGTYSPKITHPTSNGCDFVQLPPGSYKVSVGPESLTTAFVEPGSTNDTAAYPYPTGPVTVSIDQVTGVHFLYDEGAYVKVDYPDTTAADGSVTCSAQACVATGQSPSGTSTDGSTGTVATVSTISLTGTTHSWSHIHTLTGQGISKIESTECMASLCIAAGYGPTGAAVVVHKPATPGTAWSKTALPTAGLPPGLVVTEIRCPSPTTCLAIGSGRTGSAVFVGTISTGSVTWTAVGEPSVNLTQLTCPGATACRAIGSASTVAGVILAGAPATAGSWTWALAEGTLTLKLTVLRRIDCPTSTSCLAIGTGTSGTLLLAGTKSAGGTWGWTSYLTPAGVSSLSGLDCPAATSCIAVGTEGTSGAAIVSGTGTGTKSTSWTWVSDVLPTGVTSLDQVTCPSTTACLAAGTGGVLGGTRSTGWTWVSDTPPAGTTSFDQLTCPSTDTCLATGATASGAVLLSGAASGAQETWVAGNLPSSLDPTFFSGVACAAPSGAGSLACVTAGADKTGAVLLADTAVGAGGHTWTKSTPGTASGVVAGGLAVSVSNTPTPSFVVCKSSSPSLDSCTTVGPLFPFTSGYQVGAGTCTAELDSGSVHAASKPGTKRTSAATVALPLGLLSLEVLNSSGEPVPGATVTATPADPTHSACNTPTIKLTLGTTGPDGAVGVALMYETYTVKVTSSGRTTTKKISISPTSVAATGKSYPLPDQLVVLL